MHLTRVSISLERALLEAFDHRNEAKGYATRSEAIRDLIRDRLIREEARHQKGEQVVVVTMVYDHHARELASRNITVNVVAPGFITTDMTAALPDKIKAEVMERIPVRRFGTPEDIADLVCYWASPSASYVTGQVIAVDGGLTV